jgi:asparagine N-glycosylation enzyme membrane subunit Stt3
MFNDDSHFPSFAKTLLAGLEWDMLMMECLVIAAMDRARYVTSPPNSIMSGIALGTLMAFIIDNIMIGIRSGRGKAQIAIRTLVDDRKFLIT